MPLFRVPWTLLHKTAWLWSVILVVGVVLLTGSSSTVPRSTVTSPPPAATGSHVPGGGSGTTRHVVALGDSVTSGYACGCVPFPQLYGKDLSQVRGWPTSVDNLGDSWIASAGLLQQLDDRGSGFDSAVAKADIVLVTIGANDFAPSHDAVTQGDCLEDGNAECTREELSQMKTNVAAILTRIRELRKGHPTAVLVTGYWNVFEGGDVARSLYPHAGVKATHELTRQVNDALRMVATASNDTYVDLFAPFHGPESQGNVTTLLAPDGDHPNAAGHSLIARRLVAAGLPGLVQN